MVRLFTYWNNTLVDDLELLEHIEFGTIRSELIRLVDFNLHEKFGTTSSQIRSWVYYGSI